MIIRKKPVFVGLLTVSVLAIVAFVVLTTKPTLPHWPVSGDWNDIFGNGSFVFHAYWQHGFGRKQAFAIKSLLCTQRRFMERHPGSRVMLWMESDHEADTANVWVQQMRALGVAVMHYDALREAVGTPLENNSVVDKNYHRTAFRSDWARLVVLYKHGGLYFDLDTLFLKDVEPLVAEYGEFAYPWITRAGKINNAFLCFKKRGAAITDLVTRANREGRATGLHGFTGFLIAQKPRDLRLVPHRLIDFCWIDKTLCPRFDFTWFFKPLEKGTARHRRATDGLSTSYVYHWHNCWNERIVDDSPFEQHERRFDAELGVPHNVGNSTT